MKPLLASIMVSSLLVLFACSTANNRYLGDYSMVRPVVSEKPRFEDDFLSVSINIVEDSRFGLSIHNKTRQPMKVTWGKSNVVVAASGDQAQLAYRLRSGGAGTDKGVSTVAPGGTIKAEVFPKVNAYLGENGEELVRPLYCSATGEGEPADIMDNTVGVNLMVEVDSRVRLYPLMLKVNQSVPEK